MAQSETTLALHGGTPDADTARAVQALTLDEAVKFYARAAAAGDRALIRWLCLNDRFFLLVCALGLTHMNRPWCYTRCREVEASPDGWLDLWSRGHYKSTIITLGGIVQAVLRDPEITCCVLSYNSPTAQKFVNQIKQALENPALRELFPEILHAKPPKDNWSVQKGLFVKRGDLSREPTVMGSGLVDGMPTGMHFRLRVYDDVVTAESVGTPDQIIKTTDAFSLSDALGTGDGQRVWMVGTRYHPMDTYSEILKRGTAKERRRVCVDTEGRPLMLSPEALEQKQRDMGARIFAAQMMQNPVGEGVRLFRDDWLMHYDRQPDRRKLNVFFIIDSANGKRKKNDYTTMWVIGLGADLNYYVLDIVRDRINLVERTDALFSLHRKWKPMCTYWEQVGAMSDTQHVRDAQERENYRFRVVDLPQKIPKRDRIGWLVPLFQAARFWFPRRLLYRTVAGETRDLVQDFVTNEYGCYPVVPHDDMLDSLANIKHPDCAGMRFPKLTETVEGKAADKSVSKWDPYG